MGQQTGFFVMFAKWWTQLMALLCLFQEFVEREAAISSGDTPNGHSWTPVLCTLFEVYFAFPNAPTDGIFN
jgi:hypothetical protein